MWLPDEVQLLAPALPDEGDGALLDLLPVGHKMGFRAQPLAH
jgi:hypothetical protein